MTPKAEMFACPCCGYKIINKEPQRTNNICPIFFWEDEPTQLAEAKSSASFAIQSFMSCLLILTAVLTFSCNNKTKKIEFETKQLNNKFINETIQFVIDTDSLKKSEDYFYLDSLLNYTNVINSNNRCDTLEPPCPPPSNYIQFSYIKIPLMQFDKYETVERDSLFFNYQIETLNNYNLEKKYTKNLNLLSFEKIKINIDDFYKGYTFHIPLYTSDFKYAFVQYSIYPHGCEKVMVKSILKRENGKWLKLNKNGA